MNLLLHCQMITFILRTRYIWLWNTTYIHDIAHRQKLKCKSRNLWFGPSHLCRENVGFSPCPCKQIYNLGLYGTSLMHTGSSKVIVIPLCVSHDALYRMAFHTCVFRFSKLLIFVKDKLYFYNSKVDALALYDNYQFFPEIISLSVENLSSVHS